MSFYAPAAVPTERIRCKYTRCIIYAYTETVLSVQSRIDVLKNLEFPVQKLFSDWQHSPGIYAVEKK